MTYNDGQVVVGQSLNDDIWHTVSIRRRGNTIEASVDEEESKKGEQCTVGDDVQPGQMAISGQKPS